MLSSQSITPHVAPYLELRSALPDGTSTLRTASTAVMVLQGGAGAPARARTYETLLDASARMTGLRLRLGSPERRAALRRSTVACTGGAEAMTLRRRPQRHAHAAPFQETGNSSKRGKMTAARHALFPRGPRSGRRTPGAAETSAIVSARRVRPHQQRVGRVVRVRGH